MRVALAAILFLALVPAGASGQVPPLPLPPVGPPTGSAPPTPLPYGQEDAGGFRNVLPPGQNGLATLPELAAFQAGGARPAHNDDQLGMYRDLLYGYQGMSEGDVRRFFKTATFGVPDGEAERTYSPRGDVTIVRDRFGVPHIYGSTRGGALFGTGYATAEDRLFFLDVFRHLGRAQLSSFAGGAPANRTFDHMVWELAPYTEADLQQQIEARRPGYEAESEVLRGDLREYVAGINHYIAEARADPRKMPGEYAAIGRPEGPEDWKGTDTVATAAVVGSIFGVGGGSELASSQVLEAARARFGARRGRRVWSDFRSADDPEAPTTVRGRSFPYPRRTRGRTRGQVLPDPGTLARSQVYAGGTGSGAESPPRAPTAPPKAQRRGLPAFPGAMSNAIAVSARESASGRPIAVFGPQTGYFTPQALMEHEVQAPGLSARGVGFPGVNLYVQIGHGRDYAWSATTSAQDIVDTFAVDLCEPGGGTPTIESMHYLHHGECLPIEVLERKNSWQPNAGDPTPAGSETLRAERTRLGIVAGRSMFKGKPVAYTRLRATYMHEPDAGLAFSYFNNPDRIRGPKDFQRTAGLIGYTFNWFYVDARHVAYQNSGYNPRRAPGTDPDLPIRGRERYEWLGYKSDSLTLDAFTPPREHPRFVDQAWVADWNNKQAPGYHASDDNWAYGSTYRVKALADRVERLTRGDRKATRAELVAAMADAATVDLRGAAVLPFALRVIGTPRDPEQRKAVAELRAWAAAGAHRIDRDQDGTYEHANAIRIFDAWWPRWMRAQFQPVLGTRLFDAIEHVNEFANTPNNHGDHLGSAWQDGWHGYALKDLRAVLRRKVRGRYSRVYCGRGSRARCRGALLASLGDAIKVPPAEVYGGDDVCAKAGRADDQACYDAIFFRPLGGITQPLIPWQNRPTFQQVVEVGSGG